MRWIFVRNAVIAVNAVKINISPHFLQKFTAKPRPGFDCISHIANSHLFYIKFNFFNFHLFNMKLDGHFGGNFFDEKYPKRSIERIELRGVSNVAYREA